MSADGAEFIVRRRTRRGLLLPLLGYLRSAGVFDGPAVPFPADPLDRLLGEFEETAGRAERDHTAVAIPGAADRLVSGS
jgi:hypothetical protein